MEDIGKLLEGISSLIWPLVSIGLLVYFRREIGRIISSAKSRKLTIKIGGTELTLEEANVQQVKLIADLQDKVTKLEESIGSLQPPMSRELRAYTEVSLMRDVLWVDDHPKNIATLIASLKESGFNVTTVPSTRQALRILDEKEFAWILSDMARTEEGRDNEKAGLDFLREVRRRGIKTPVAFYTSTRSANTLREEVLNSGAVEITASASTLLSVLKTGVESSA
jgi:CheY-like chemotaxis protein